MCSIKDASRHLQLAQFHEQSGEGLKAYEQYLEATSIYLLQGQLQQDDHLTETAKECYHKSQNAIGRKTSPSISTSALAHHTLHELDAIQHKENNFSSHMHEHMHKAGIAHEHHDDQYNGSIKKGQEVKNVR